MAEGTAVPARGEAVLPAALARLSGIRMGDRITISGLQPRVTGLSRETFSMAASITFLPISDLEEILSTFGAVSYILVKAAPGVDPGDLARRIEKSVEKVSVLTREQFIRSDFELAMQMGVEVIALMTLIGGALAAIIVAFTAYSHTVRQRREIAIIKALGARNSAVYLSIVAQAFGITFAGFVIGFLLIEFLAALIPRLLPLVSLSVAGSDALHTALAAFLVAIAASMLPANTVVRVDPASAFND